MRTLYQLKPLIWTPATELGVPMFVTVTTVIGTFEIREDKSTTDDADMFHLILRDGDYYTVRKFHSPEAAVEDANQQVLLVLRLHIEPVHV